MTLIDRIKPWIVNLRRGIETERSFGEFRAIVEGDLDAVCTELNTRWLVSLCDTYVDFGEPIEQRNAMLVSMLVNWEKVAQSYVLWKSNYEGSLEVPEHHEPRKLFLWDGMTSFHLEIGDVTNNLFARTQRLLAETPQIERIYRTVLERIEKDETILGTLNKRHGHVFETSFEWVRDPRYDRYRENGEIPPWKG